MIEKSCEFKTTEENCVNGIMPEDASQETINKYIEAYDANVSDEAKNTWAKCKDLCDNKRCPKVIN